MKKLIYILIFISLTNCKAQKTTMMEEQIVIPEITNEFETFDIDSKIENTFVKEKEFYVKNTKQSFGFAQHIILENSPFSIAKFYFKNRNIKEKGIMFNNGAEYGIWYHYDEKGNLIKEENTDLGYDFGWLDVIKYCHKNNIVLEKGYPKRGGIKTEIYKNEEEGKKVWTITYYNAKKDEYLEVTFDGTTGKELKRRELEFIGN